MLISALPPTRQPRRGRGWEAWGGRPKSLGDRRGPACGLRVCVCVRPRGGVVLVVCACAGARAWACVLCALRRRDGTRREGHTEREARGRGRGSWKGQREEREGKRRTTVKRSRTWLAARLGEDRRRERAQRDEKTRRCAPPALIAAHASGRECGGGLLTVCRMLAVCGQSECPARGRCVRARY